MKHNRRPVAILLSLLILSLAIAQASSERARIGNVRRLALPSRSILDDRCVPLLTADGKAGFVSSITDGSVISFSLETGQVISSVIIGETAGELSLVEYQGRRLIAVPAANDPDHGKPVTVSIIDATDPANLELQLLLVLPDAAHITQRTKASLTADGRYVLIASSFDEPALYAFSVESGQLVSQFQLIGRPAEINLFDQGSGMPPTLAIVSSVANTLSLLELGEGGTLSRRWVFTPSGAHFEESNNPAFSTDGQTLFVSAASGGRLFGIDSLSGELIASTSVGQSPQRTSVARGADGRDTVAVTRVPTGGVALFKVRGRHFSEPVEFNTPAEIKLSRSNNVVIDPDSSVAFVGSATGMLFAFSSETGELQSYEVMGRELLSIALNMRARVLAAVKRGPAGDEIMVVGFDIEAADETEGESTAPKIIALKPASTEQGRIKSLTISVRGDNFVSGSALLVNGASVSASIGRGGKILSARLDKSLFNQAGDLRVEVKNPDGQISNSQLFRVMRPADPAIERVSPGEVPAPIHRVGVAVVGRNFRVTSTIHAQRIEANGDRGQEMPLNTERVNDTKLRVLIPSNLTRNVGRIAIRVIDSTVSGVASNEEFLTLFGPRITGLRPSRDNILAGTGGFRVKIDGSNFRDGAQVRIGTESLAAFRVNRVSAHRIVAFIPGRMVDTAQKLLFVVRNPDGSESEAKDMETLAPVIEGFEGAPVIAGSERVRIGIRGSFFRKQSGVRLQTKDRTVEVRPSRVRFRSRQLLTVILSGSLRELISQPGNVSVQVINPNRGEGVASEAFDLEVAAPQIEGAAFEPDPESEDNLLLVVTGAHFREGALVQLFAQGLLYLEENSASTQAGRIVLRVKKRRVDAVGSLNLVNVAIVNPHGISSNRVRPVSHVSQSQQQ